MILNTGGVPIEVRNIDKKLVRRCHCYPLDSVDHGACAAEIVVPGFSQAFNTRRK